MKEISAGFNNEGVFVFKIPRTLGLDNQYKTYFITIKFSHCIKKFSTLVVDRCLKYKNLNI